MAWKMDFVLYWYQAGRSNCRLSRMMILDMDDEEALPPHTVERPFAVWLLSQKKTAWQHTMNHQYKSKTLRVILS